MGGDDGEIGKISGKLVDGSRVRMADLGPHAARNACAHAGRADIDHHRRFQLVDNLEERVMLAVIDRKMPHNGVEMETEHAVHLDRLFRLADRDLTLERVDRAPGLDHAVRMAFPHAGDVFVRTRRRVDRGFQIERDQHGVHTGGRELGDHIVLFLGQPFAVPVLGKCAHIGALAVDPGLGVRVTVQIDNAHLYASYL